jgi:hypothetical protein
MLATDQRVLLVDLLTPPVEDFHLERAVGTTFTLQLESLLRIPLAVAGAEWQVGADPLGVLQAVRTSADRIDVFCQAGMVSVPASSAGILAFLEPVVHQVARPRPGRLFHPKLWLLSFVNAAGERRFRFVCGSRNLTDDRAWDTVLRLDGLAGGRARSVNRPLSEFVGSLADRVPAGVPTDRAAAVAELAQHVRTVAWEAPDGVFADDDWLTFHVFGPGRRTAPEMSGHRRLVISPFLNLDGVETVWPDHSPCTIVTRPESVTALPPEDRVRLLDEWGADVRLIDDTAAVPDTDSDQAGLQWSMTGLHAKVYLVERGHRAHIFIGSANATDAAWSGNDEILVEIVGRRGVFGIDKVLGDTDGGLATILTPYVDGTYPEPPDTSLSDRLEHHLVTLAQLTYVATATSTDEDRWSETIETKEPVPANDLGARLTVRPLTTHPPAHVAAGKPLVARWDDLAPEDLTPFVVLELAAGPTTNPVTASCVVLTRLDGAPDDRLDRVLARHVGSPEQFLRFLLLLLNGSNDDALLAALNSTGDGGFGQWGASGAGAFESLVAAIADAPDAIDEVGRLVDRLSATAHGRAVLPDGWEQLWASVTGARELLAIREVPT